MSFSEAWLRQREPYDHQARSVPLVRRFAEAVGRGRVLDLGGGLGSGARFLRRHAPALDVWVVDHDEALLEAAAAEGLDTLRADLRAVDWPEADGLHCQALLDLVSWSWLDGFVERLARRPVPLLATLTVDGRVDFDPVDPDDAEVMAAFREHQRLDRGFGASPGPEAAQVLGARLERAGWEVAWARADWRVPATDRAMVSAMVAGIVEAAAEMSARPERVRAWGERRAGALTVGHLDLLALPPSSG